MEYISAQLKKGVLDILLLKLLQDKPMYGYELMSTLGESTSGFFASREGTLYPILYRLEDAGLIQSQWEQEERRRGVPRKYYALTPAGEAHLRHATQALADFMRGIEQVMGRLL